MGGGVRVVRRRGHVVVRRRDILRMLYASGILGGLFLDASIPLGFELATETAFPHVAPAHASGLLCTVNTLTQIIFLSLPPGAAWANWANGCACFLCLAPFAFFRASYERLDLDLEQEGVE